MEAPPDAPKRISVTALLLPLMSVFLTAVMMAWQMRVAKQQPVVPAEISAAETFLKANDVEKARQQYEKLLAKNPESPAHYKVVMASCGKFGRIDLACQYGERAIQSCRYAPTSARADLYITLSGCYSAGHEPPPQPRAVEYARRALELAPDDPNALNSLGYRLAENVRTESEANIALGYLNRAISILRGQVGASADLLAQTEDSYGWALYKRGRFHSEDYAHGADALSQAIDDLPEDEPADVQKIMYYHLGVSSRAAGRIEEARHALQIALVYDPQYEDARRELNSLPPTPVITQSNSGAASTATPVNHPTPPASIVPATAAQSPAIPTRTPNGKTIFRPLREDAPAKQKSLSASGK